MKARVEREMAVAALSGSDEQIRELIEGGLRSFVGVRSTCYSMMKSVLAVAHKRRHYVATRLPYGANLKILLYAPSSTFPAGREVPIIEITLRSGGTASTQDAMSASGMLTERIRGNPAAAVKVLLAIERARRQVLALAEEGTRWQ